MTEEPILSVRNLRAYYQMKYFGITREVKAVDDITLEVKRNEIYGLAGESSCGKTSFIKTIAGANRPPLNVLGGSALSGFLDRDIFQLSQEALAAVRWKHLSYVMPIVFATTMNNMNWSIGLEVTLSVLGFTDINSPTIGGMIYWANQHTALVAGVWWWLAFPVVLIIMLFIGLFLLAVSMNEYIDPRSRLSRMGGGAG